mgnify:CR=1 FL=1
MTPRTKYTIILSLVFIALCIPKVTTYKDGGTKKYQAVLWSYVDYCRIEHGLEQDKDDDGFRFFPFNCIDNE